MLELRPYASADAVEIVKWAESERALRLWTADRFAEDPWPLAAERFDGYYGAGDPLLRPMTAVEAGAAVGHVLLRRLPAEAVRLGFVIVDPARRGTGLGRRMVEAACGYAVREMGARRLTLGVFEENAAARRCYEAAGFRAVETRPWLFCGRTWQCIEMERRI